MVPYTTTREQPGRRRARSSRRRFSKRIEEGDIVEIADDLGGPSKGYYGEELRTVRVVRDGRVVALVFYKEGLEDGGGWLLDSYESCGEF